MSEDLREQLAHLERKNAELTAALEQLQAREERWRTIVSTDPECVKTISPDGYLIEMNPAGLAMLSASTIEQVRSKPILEWIAPEHRAAFTDLHQRVQAGQSGDLEFEVIGLGGTRRWLRTQACPLRDRTGAITSTLGISRDITGQRELEAQLRQSQKMEAIGQLAGGIAHDFNNILTVIQGFALTLLEGESDQRARDSATRHIVEAAERAARLTRQLLAFGRRQVMHPQHVDLNELVTSLATMIRRVLGEEIDLQVQLWPAPLSIHADRGLIDQVLMNLVINARDSMPAGGVIRVETHTQTSPQDASAIVRVIDQGTGILTITCPGSSIRSSPPRRQARDRDSGLPRPSASWRSTVAASRSRAGLAAAARLRFRCPSQRHSKRSRLRRARRCRIHAAARRGSCWWKTKTRSAR